jgi:hypothetical protein
MVAGHAGLCGCGPLQWRGKAWYTTQTDLTEHLLGLVELPPGYERSLGARFPYSGLTMAIHSSRAPRLHPNLACPSPRPSASMICAQLHPAVSWMVKELCDSWPLGAVVSKMGSSSVRAKRFTLRLFVGIASGTMMSWHKAASCHGVHRVGVANAECVRRWVRRRKPGGMRCSRTRRCR